VPPGLSSMEADRLIARGERVAWMNTPVVSHTMTGEGAESRTSCELPVHGYHDLDKTCVTPCFSAGPSVTPATLSLVDACATGCDCVP